MIVSIPSAAQGPKEAKWRLGKFTVQAPAFFMIEMGVLF
jgi:hypothetical protein